MASNHDEAIGLFASLTGADPATATQYLSACNYDVEQAFNMFSLSASDAPTPNNESAFGAGASGRPASGDVMASQMAADAAMAASLAGEGSGPSPAGFRSPGGVSSANSGGGAARGERPSPAPRDQASRSGQGPGRRGQPGARRGQSKGSDEYGEDGVRVQDEYKTTRMVGGPDDMQEMMRAMLGGGSTRRGMGGGEGGGYGAFGGPRLGATEGTEQLLAAMAEHGMGMGAGVSMGGMGRRPGMPPPVVDISDEKWMFQPPPGARRLNCGGDIAYARQRARDERKWVLVSIQGLEQFESHRLNRDTWKDDTVLSLLESSFVFWQRSNSCDQGRGYMRLYSIPDDHLPQISIIGPTGAKVYSTTGFTSPTDLSAALVEFLDTNDLDSEVAPKVKDGSKNHRRTLDPEFEPTSPPLSQHLPTTEWAEGAIGDRARGSEKKTPAASAAAATAQSTGGGSSASDAFESEDRQLAEAIRLSMGDGGSAKSGGIDAVDDLAASLTAKASLTVKASLTAKATVSGAPTTAVASSARASSSASSAASLAHSKAPAAAAGASPVPVAAAPCYTPPVAVASAHLPLGWESALRPEPAAGTPGSTRLQLRLATGKTLVRRFMAADAVACIFAVAVEQVPEANSRPFTLQTPVASGVKLLDVASDTLEAQGLTNSKLIMQWDAGDAV